LAQREGFSAALFRADCSLTQLADDEHSPVRHL
jgi:hypothetical protein